ncbi:MAG: discoidin domain-containing protein, partial [Clostridia bacterium]|nr:discoidin domain-containing protein [Clostridia bacterium]
AQASTRMYFDGSSLVVPAEDVSALSITRYGGETSVTMLDLTSGYREDIMDDVVGTGVNMYIDDRINFAGIVIGENEDNVTLTHVFPAYTNRAKDEYIWRLLPLDEGLTRDVSFSVSVGNEKTFAEAMKTAWRRAYSRYSYVDARYSAEEIYNVMIDHLTRSYSGSNIWGNIPQYMTTADHYFPDSGFLYRNLEIGTLMLKRGRETNDHIMINNAWNVINYQLDNDKLDMRINAYPRDNSVFKRVLYDGLGSAVELYAYQKEADPKNTSFNDKLLYYILEKAEKFKDDTSLMALNFYMPLFRYGEKLHMDYSSVALRLLDLAAKQTKDFGGYFGAIESSNTRLSVAEDYMIILRAFVDAYEITDQKGWLDRSVTIADYLETYNMIQPIDLCLKGATGAEGCNMGFIGNERFLANGYHFNNTNHHIYDCSNTSAVVEYYKLYEYTGDKHYLDFAEMKLYNSFIYVNMGDKVGHMDDPLHSSGMGFINEFAGCSAMSLSYKDSGVRGAVHDSVIAWNIWQLVSGIQWFRENVGEYTPFGEEDLVHDLAKGRYIYAESSSARNSALNAVDGDPLTYWSPSGSRCATIDLNEHCEIKGVRIKASGNASAKLSFSSDGKTFGEAKVVTFSNGEGTCSVETSARYVKAEMTGGDKVFSIEVKGVPVKYYNFCPQSEIVEGNAAADQCLDFSDYSTVWAAGSSETEKSVTIDLGAEREIYMTALKFRETCSAAYKIEVSSDGTVWSEYADDSGETVKYVFVNEKYTRARYVKLTLISSSEKNFNLSDFKVMGRKNAA